MAQQNNTTVIDNRLHPQYATRDEHLLVFITEQNLVAIDAVVLTVTLSSH